MKRIFITLWAVVLLTTVLTGCSSKKKEIAPTDNGNHGTSHIQGEEQANVIVLSEKILPAQI